MTADNKQTLHEVAKQLQEIDSKLAYLVHAIERSAAPTTHRNMVTDNLISARSEMRVAGVYMEYLKDPNSFV